MLAHRVRTSFREPVLTCVLCGALFAAGCGDPSGRADSVASDADASADAPEVVVQTHQNPGGSGEMARATLGAAGGRLALGALTLEVPEGALREPTELVVTELVTPADASIHARTPVYRLAPDGLVFARRVTATFAVTDPPSRPMQALWSVRGVGPRALGKVVAVAGASTSELRLHVRHFSDGVASEPAVPAALLDLYEVLTEAGDAAVDAQALADLEAGMRAWADSIVPCHGDAIADAIYVAAFVVGFPEASAATRTALMARAAVVVEQTLLCERGVGTCDVATVEALVDRALDLPALDAIGLLTTTSLAAESAAFAAAFATRLTCTVGLLASCDAADVNEAELAALVDLVGAAEFPFPSAADYVALVQTRFGANLTCAASARPDCQGGEAGLDLLADLAARLAGYEARGLSSASGRATLQASLAGLYVGDFECRVQAITGCPDQALDKNALKALRQRADDPTSPFQEVAGSLALMIQSRVRADIACEIARAERCQAAPGDQSGLDRLDALASELPELVTQGLLGAGDEATLRAQAVGAAGHEITCILASLDTCVDQALHTDDLATLLARVASLSFFEPGMADPLRAQTAHNIECAIDLLASCQTSGAVDLDSPAALVTAAEALAELVANGLLSDSQAAALEPDIATTWTGEIRCLLGKLDFCASGDADFAAYGRLLGHIAAAPFPKDTLVADVHHQVIEDLDCAASLGAVCTGGGAADPASLADLVALAELVPELVGIDLLSASEADAARSSIGSIFSDEVGCILGKVNLCADHHSHFDVYATMLDHIDGAPFDTSGLDVRVRQQVAEDLRCAATEAAVCRAGGGPDEAVLADLVDLGGVLSDIVTLGLLTQGEADAVRSALGTVYAEEVGCIARSFDGCPDEALRDAELRALYGHVVAAAGTFPGMREPAEAAISDVLWANLQCVILPILRCKLEGIADPAEFGTLVAFVHRAADLHDEGLFTDATALAADELLSKEVGDTLACLLPKLDTCVDDIDHEAALRALHGVVTATDFPFPPLVAAARSDIEDTLIEGLECLVLADLACRVGGGARPDELRSLEVAADTLDAWRAEGLVAADRAAQSRAGLADEYAQTFACYLDLYACDASEPALHAAQLSALAGYLTTSDHAFAAEVEALHVALSDRAYDNLGCVLDELVTAEPSLALLDALDGLDDEAGELAAAGLITPARRDDFKALAGGDYESAFVALVEEADGCGTPPDTRYATLHGLLGRAVTSAFTERADTLRSAVQRRFADNLRCIIEEDSAGPATYDALLGLITTDPIVVAFFEEGLLDGDQMQALRTLASDGWYALFGVYLGTLAGCDGSGPRTNEVRALVAMIADPTFPFFEHTDAARPAVRERFADNVRCEIDAQVGGPATAQALSDLVTLDGIVLAFFEEGLLDGDQMQSLRTRASDGWVTLSGRYLATLDGCAGSGLYEAELRALVAMTADSDFPFFEHAEATRKDVADRLHGNLECDLVAKLRCASQAVAEPAELDAIEATLAQAESFGDEGLLGHEHVAEMRQELPLVYAESWRCIEGYYDACVYAPHDLFSDELDALLLRIERPDFAFAAELDTLKGLLRERMTSNVPCAIAFAVECESLGPSLDALDALDTIGFEARAAWQLGLIADEDFPVLFEEAETAYDDELTCVRRELDSCDDPGATLFAHDLSLLLARVEDDRFAFPDLTDGIHADLQVQAYDNVVCEALDAGSCTIDALNRIEELGHAVADLALEDLLDGRDEDDLTRALAEDFDHALACKLVDYDGCNDPGAPLYRAELELLLAWVGAPGFVFAEQGRDYSDLVTATAGDNLVCAVEAVVPCDSDAPSRLHALETTTLAGLTTAGLLVAADATRAQTTIDRAQCAALACDLILIANGGDLSAGTDPTFGQEHCPMNITFEVPATDPLLPSADGFTLTVNAATFALGTERTKELPMPRGQHLAEVRPTVSACPGLKVGGKFSVCCGLPPGESCDKDKLPVKYASSYSSGPETETETSTSPPRGPILRRPTQRETASNGWGDPHLTTADGNGWTSYALGELIYRASDIPGAIEVQARHGRLPGFQDWASFIVAVALRAGDTTLEVRMPRDLSGAFDLSTRRPLETLLDGVVVDLAPGTYAPTSDLAFVVGKGGGVRVSYRDPASTSATGVTTVEIGTRAEKGLLRADFDPQEPVVSLDLELAGAGLWRGVAGTPNGDRDDDFLLPDGSDAYGPDDYFMNAWRVTTLGESLFTYPPGEGPATWNIAQTSSLPAMADLGPFLGRVDTMLVARCGLELGAVAALDTTTPGFRASIAFELAAGRTEKNLVANGLCADPRIAPPPEAVVGFAFSGQAALAGRPDLGLGGASVTVSAHDPDTGAAVALCATATLADGYWACAAAVPGDALGDATLVRMVASGRGPPVTLEALVDVPVPGAPALELTGDFALTPLRALEVRGLVTGRSGLPAAGARLGFEGLATGRATADADGRYRFGLALPDGLARGILTVTAAPAPPDEGGGVASAAFDALPLGVTSVSLDVAIGDEAAALPLAQPVFYAVFQGRVMNRTARATLGVDAPIQGAVVVPEGDGWRNARCLGPSDAKGRFACLVECRRDDVDRCALGLALRVDGAIAYRADLAPPLDGDRHFAPDIALERSTLAVSGHVANGQGQPLANASVTLRTLDGVVASGVTDGLGQYRVYLAGPAGAAWTGTLLATWRWAAAPEASPLIATAEASFDVVADRLRELVLDATLDGRTLAFTGRIVNDHLPETSPLRGVGGARVVISAAVPGDPGSRAVICDVASTRAADPAEVGFYRCEVPVPGGAAGLGAWQVTWDVSEVGAASHDETLDLTSIASGTVFPVPRSFATAPATVLVDGRVIDSEARPASGAGVGLVAHIGGLSFAAPAIPTDADGRYSSALAFPDATIAQGAGQLQIEAVWGQGELARSGRAFRAVDPSPGAALPLTVEVVLSGPIPPDDEVARLHFEGLVTNSHVPGLGVPGVAVTIAGVGADSGLGTVCAAVTDAAGVYRCDRMLAAATSSLSLGWSATLGSATLAATSETRTIVRSALFVNALSRDLAIAPTTLRISGRVGAGGGGEPFAGALVGVSGLPAAWVRGSATSDAQGDYALHLVFPDSATQASGAASITALGETISAPFDVALTPRGLTSRTLDLDFPFYRLDLRGTVDNLRAAGALVPGVDVALAVDGEVVCRAVSNRQGFTCAAPLRRTPADGGLTLGWLVGDDETGETGVVAVSAAELPAPGEQATIDVAAAILAPALTIDGHVADGLGDPIGDQAVALTITDPDAALSLQPLTDAAGAYTTTLSFAAPRAVDLTASASRGLASVTVTDELALPDALTRRTLDLAFSVATQLRLSGVIRNANDALSPLTSGRLRVEASAPTLPLRTLCEVTATSGSYLCEALIADHALTALTLHATWLREQTPMAPPVAIELTGLDADGAVNPVARDVAVLPTTLVLSGQVSNGAGLGLGASTIVVDASEPLLDVTTSTDAAGHWSVTRVAPPSVTRLAGTLLATRQGLATTLTLDEPIAPYGRTSIVRDHVLAERNVVVRGRVVSSHADVGLGAQEVTLVDAVGGAIERCRVTSGAGGVFSCPGIVRSTDAPFDLAWSATGPYGTSSGTLTIAADDLPGPGQSGFVARDLAVDATTLHVSGALTKNGAPIVGGSIAASATTAVGGDEVTTASAAAGAYALDLVLPIAAVSATLTLVGSDLADAVTVELPVTLAVGGLTSAEVALAITTGTYGASAWQATLANPSNLPLRTDAPPARDAARGRIYLALGRAVYAIDETTGAIVWTDTWASADIAVSNVALADGKLWVATTSKLLVLTDLGASAARASLALPHSIFNATLLPTSDGRLILFELTRLHVFDRASQVLLWQDYVPGWSFGLSFDYPSGVALHPDGTLVVVLLDEITGVNLGDSGPSERFHTKVEGLARGPVIGAAGDIFIASTYGLLRLAPSGERLGALAWEADTVSHPSLTADGNVVLTRGDHLHVLRPDGDTFVALLDAPLTTSARSERAAPLVLGSGAGAIAFMTTHDGSGAASVHAMVLGGPAAGSPLFAAYLAPGASFLTSPMAVPGAVVAMSDHAVFAVARPAGDPSGPWPRFGRADGNDFAPPLELAPRRFVAVSGAVVNANAPEVPAPAIGVAMTDAGVTLSATTSDELQRYATVAPTNHLEAFDIGVRATAYGAVDTATATIAAGAAGSTTSVVADLALPITTLVVEGVITVDGVPTEGIGIGLDSAAAFVSGDAVSGPGGAYRITALFDAAVTDTTVSLGVANWLGTFSANPAAVSLTPGGLTTLTLNAASDQAGELLALGDAVPGEGLELTAGAALGDALVLMAMTNDACDDDGCDRTPTLVRVAADGNVGTTGVGFATVHGELRVAPPAVDPSGRVVVAFSRPGTLASSGLNVYDGASADLAFLYTIDLGAPDAVISPPTVVATSPTATRVYALVDVDNDGVAVLHAWDLDFSGPAVSHTVETLETLAPACFERCIAATADVVAFGAGGRFAVVDPASPLTAVLDEDVESGWDFEPLVAPTGIFAAPMLPAVLGVANDGVALTGFPVTLAEPTVRLARDGGGHLWTFSGSTLTGVAPDGGVAGSLSDVCASLPGLAVVGDTAWVTCEEQVIEIALAPTPSETRRLPTGLWLDYAPVATTSHIVIVTAGGSVLRLARP